jgi:hypothetical protein
LIVAALTSALAVFLKAVALFFTLGAFLALAFHRQGIRGLISLQTQVFVLLSLGLTAIFYGDVVIQNSLGDHAQMGFSPRLLLQPSFWQLWLMKIQSFIGLTAFVVALIGIMVARDCRRTLLFSLWIAYLCYGVTKTENIFTHDYYQLPLVPIAALSLGPSLALITRWLAQHQSVTLNRLAIIGAAAALLALVPLDLQDLPDRSWFDKEIAIAEAIGTSVHHSTNVIVLGERAERPLRYHGEFAGTYWPNLNDIGEDNEAIEKHWLALEESRKPEYFVIRDQAEFRRQPELRDLLPSKYHVLEETADYLIFVRSDDGRAGRSVRP